MVSANAMLGMKSELTLLACNTFSNPQCLRLATNPRRIFYKFRQPTNQYLSVCCLIFRFSLCDLLVFPCH